MKKLETKQQIFLVVVIIASIAGNITFLMWTTMQEQKLEDALSGDLNIAYAQTATPSKEQMESMASSVFHN